MDRQSNTVDQRVRNADRHHRKRPEREALTRQHLDQVGVVEQPMFIQLALHQGEREFCAVNRHIQLRKNPGKSANMIFVSMGQEDCLNFVPVLGQVADVRNDDIDAEELFFRKHQAGVDDNNVVLPTERHAVHPELAKASQWNHA